MAAVQVTSAAGLISLLEEPTPEVRSFALSRLNKIVDEFWPEISEVIEKIEVLHEDQVFHERKLAALVASKVYYHLGSYDDALAYALGAGDLFDVNQPNQYVEILMTKCIDQYTELRKQLIDSNNVEVKIDKRMELIVDRMFERCLEDGEFKQAIGIALETRRLDVFRTAIERCVDKGQILKYAYEVAMTLIQNRAFRSKVLRDLVEMYRNLEVPDYINVCQCLIFLHDALSIGHILLRLSTGSEDDQLMAFQVAFDLYESATQEFLVLVKEALDNLSARDFNLTLQEDEEGQGCSNFDKKDSAAAATASAEEEAAIATVIKITVAKMLRGNVTKLKRILSGELSIQLHLQFLIRTNKTDYLILKQTKESVRASICHTAIVIANAFMNSGTTSDYFLRENLEWLSRASNWSKMTAVASLGVIHRGHEKDALTFMQTYLPRDAGRTAGYTESGALYALGLIHANHGANITQYLVQQLKDAPNEIIKHGGCLGLGLAAMGTCDVDIYEQLRYNLFLDDAVVGEGAGLAMGLVMLASGNVDAVDEMVAYSEESQHEKISRGLAVGIALTMFGRLEEADGLIERLIRDKDPNLRRSAMHTIAMAYCGSGNNAAIRKLLHVSVSDVNDDVRRAAVMSLGFLLFRSPNQCPSVVSLLAESYNPHVRYGAAMALGIACAGTGLKEALNILEPMIESDRINYVRQGALIASAMILVQHTAQTCPKAKQFRQQYADVVKDKHEDVMCKFGAIVAQGIVDAGGRNVTLRMESRTGHVNMLAVVGTLIFTQHWCWFPLAHCLSLAFSPTCLIALNGELNMPRMLFKSNGKPSMFAYPPPTEEKKREEMVKTSSALLSIAARRGRRDKYRQRSEASEGKRSRASSASSSRKTGKEEKDKEENNKENEADFEMISNPGRVMQQQLRMLSMDEGSHYVPLKDVTIGGLILFKNIDPDQEDIVEFVAAFGPKASEEKEAPPPEPFEWTDE